MALGALTRMMMPLQRRVMLMIGRCVLRAVRESAVNQRLQLELLPGELIDDVERIQNYGFNSVPLAGAEGVAVFLTGSRSKGLVVVADDRRYRPHDWLPGETGVYDWLGKFIKLGADGTLTIHAPKVVIEAADIRQYASNSYREDVGGYAEQLAVDGAAWKRTNWTIGATVTSVDNPVEPPRVGAP